MFGRGRFILPLQHQDRHMKLIYEILRKLRSQEIRQLRDRFKQASFEYERVGKLFDLVTQYEEKEEAFYAQELYQRKPDNTFRVTKSRLKRMMENVMLTDKSLGSYRSKLINARLQLRKKLLQAEILLGRGAYQAGKNLLQNIISTAKKYELLEEEYRAELLLYRNLNLRAGVKDYQKLTERLLKTNQLLAGIDEAKILYYSVANLLVHQTLQEAERQEVRSTIDRLGEIEKLTNHPQVQHLYFLSEIYYQQIDEHFDEALKFCQNYLELIQQNESLYTPQREATAYGQIAQAHLALQNMEEAQTYAQQTLGMFSPDEINYLRSLELSFVVAYYAHQSTEAHQYIQLAMHHPQLNTSPYISARWHYFEACQLFRENQFQAAYLKLNDTTPLLADKHGMNLQIRLLEIILLYELGHHDLLETKILNLKQFVKRSRNKQAIDANLMVFRLNRWHRNDFDFEYAVAENPQGDENKIPSFRGAVEDMISLDDWMRGQQKAN